MKKKQKIDLGEYVIMITYDDETSELDVTILDELGDVIDGLEITNDDDEFNPNLN